MHQYSTRLGAGCRLPALLQALQLCSCCCCRGGGGSWWQQCPNHGACAPARHATYPQAQLQRSGVSAITHIRCLGHGAYAAVDLVSMRVGAARKLLVSKRLQQQTQTLRPSSQADWEREASMHRACAGCPFVLQLLAAKRCRSGELLLLTEYASRGSITQLMARTRAAAALASSITSSRGGITSSGDAVLCAVRATPACSGGLSEASTQFVAACVLMALQWMHERRMLHRCGRLSASGACHARRMHMHACVLALTLPAAALPAAPLAIIRDVKPCNVLLFRDGYVKLGDLGCCCVLPPGMHARTRTGTAAYLAPEVAGGDTPYGAAVDM